MIRPLVMAPVVKDLDGTTRSAKFDPKSAIGRGRIRQIKVQELEQEMASGGVTRKDKRLGGTQEKPFTKQSRPLARLSLHRIR